MRKLWLSLLLVPMFAFVTTDWVSVQLNNRVSVSFPTQPDEKEMSGNQVWVQDAGSDARCMVMMMDFNKFGMDSTMLSAEMQKEESFEQFQEGIIGQIEGAKLISRKKTTTNGYLTFEYVIDMGKTDEGALNIMYNKNVFVGAMMYSLSFYEKNKKPQAEVRNKFFNSLKIK